MNKEQAAYIKGVAYSIEVQASTILRAVQALQSLSGHSLASMSIDLISINFKEVEESNRHIQFILSELLPNVPQELQSCEVCKKTDVPFIHVEVCDSDNVYQWLNVCSDECLQQVTLRWKQISEIIRPNEARGA